MIRNLLKRDTLLLSAFLVAALAVVGYVAVRAAGCGENGPLILAAAVCCLVFLGFSFLSIGTHLKNNADELYSEELGNRAPGGEES